MRRADKYSGNNGVYRRISAATGRLPRVACSTARDDDDGRSSFVKFEREIRDGCVVGGVNVAARPGDQVIA